MFCEICKTELIQDSFGLFCPNESCCYISSNMSFVLYENRIIPLLYENEKLIKWVEVDYYNMKWYLNGLLHRENGPAIENSDGTKFWYVNGKLHREDGPAVEYSDGTKMWYLNGNLHRINGPALERCDGSKFWYVNGKLHREDGPAIEYSNGDKLYYLYDKPITPFQLFFIRFLNYWFKK